MICSCCGKPKKPANIEGIGTALKPAMELVAVARKPLSEKTVLANILAHGVGGLNIDACRVEASDADDLAANWDRATVKDMRGGNLIGGVNSGIANTSKGSSLGRWPANICHDGSPEVLAGFPETGISTGGGGLKHGIGVPDTKGGGAFYEGSIGFGDSGSAARFFATFPEEPQQRFWYGSKAAGDDRLGSKHPTVKPIALLQWLVKLVCPPGGTVLDCFAGTGTTGEAAWREGMNAILIEREPEYIADIARRMELATMPTKRAAVAATKNNLDNPNDLPLFAEIAK